jgi:hypothetical protein
MGGEDASQTQYAAEDQKGTFEEMRGPGRHFINPIIYDVNRVPDIVVPAGKIVLLQNKLGNRLPEGKLLAEKGEQGPSRRVLTPGTWRVNEFGQTVIKNGQQEVWETLRIPIGSVGVMTMLEGPNKGVVTDRVLQPGLYNINPISVTVDIVEVGYWTWEKHVEYERTETTNSNGVKEVKKVIKSGTGICFNLGDGLLLQLDMTVVWGLFPEDTPLVVPVYKTIAGIESMVIEPQVLSICKNNGSDLTTQEFIEGQTREKYQKKVTDALVKMGADKHLRIKSVLIRGFHVSQNIAQQIQARRIAEEETKTVLVEQQREGVLAQLREAEKVVEVAVQDFDSETKAITENEKQTGLKKAAEIRAEADRRVAGLRKQAAEFNARITKTLGKATADVTKATQEADATESKFMIEAYGDAKFYNLACFADSLPANISVEYLYAGPGTLWTDSHSLKELAAKSLLDGKNQGGETKK